jgi:alpha-beta hydrolase superfamily lysophospholipase
MTPADRRRGEECSIVRTRTQRVLNAVQRPEAYREVLLDSAGSPIALSVWEGRPGWPVVVFLPGTMTHPLFYEELLDALNLAGLSVVGVHPSGHGKSPRVQRRLTFEAVIQNAGDAVTWAQGTFPGTPTLVVGSSQGGMLAMTVAARCHGLAAVFAHNVLDPSLPGTLAVTRAPRWLAPLYPQLRRALPAIAKIAPGVPVPFDAYLDMQRVSSDPEVAEFFHTDPLGLRSYPVSFLIEMITADPPGPARCDVVILAAAGDPLFSLDYTRQVFDGITAPHKELVVLPLHEHLIFNAAISTVLPELLPRMLAYVNHASSAH